MFTAAPLAVVLVSDHDGTDAFRFIPAGDLRHSQPRFACQDIRTLARLRGKRIVRTQEHIVADLVQMAAELEPRPGRRNMVRGCLALSLDQEREFLKILAVPAWKGLQKL